MNPGEKFQWVQMKHVENEICGKQSSIRFCISHRSLIIRKRDFQFQIIFPNFDYTECIGSGCDQRQTAEKEEGNYGQR